MSTHSDRPTYHDIGICDTTLGVDALLTRYSHDRTTIIQQIKSDPSALLTNIWTPSGPLAVDNNCLCQMGTCDRRSPYSCSQCKNLRRLVDFRYSVIDTPFTIQCGRFSGQQLVVSKHIISSPFLKWDQKAARHARKFVQHHCDLTKCGTSDISTQKCITGDPFTTSILINWSLYEQFTTANLTHITPLHTAFICRGIGYTVKTNPTIGSFADVLMNPLYTTSDSARAIITQLLVILKESNKINFTHGRPAVESLSFGKEPVSYKYDGIHVKGPLTVLMGNFGNSSVTINDVHYFPYNVKSDLYIEKNLFVPEIAMRADEPVFRLTNKTIDIYLAMRHIGFPLYVGAFDFYCFMVSLMQYPVFAQIVKNNAALNRIWQSMWDEGDLACVERDILIPTTDVVDIVRGKWMRCDVVTHLWSQLK
jgi:hypothetical protein